MHCGETAICEFAGVLTLVGIFIPFFIFQEGRPGILRAAFYYRRGCLPMRRQIEAPGDPGGLLQVHLTAYIRQFSQPKLVGMGTIAIRGPVS